MCQGRPPDLGTLLSLEHVTLNWVLDRMVHWLSSYEKVWCGPPFHFPERQDAGGGEEAETTRGEGEPDAGHVGDAAAPARARDELHRWMDRLAARSAKRLRLQTRACVQGSVSQLGTTWGGNRRAEVRGQRKPSNDPRNKQHNLGTPTTGHR